MCQARLFWRFFVPYDGNAKYLNCTSSDIHFLTHMGHKFSAECCNKSNNFYIDSPVCNVNNISLLS